MPKRCVGGWPHYPKPETPGEPTRLDLIFTTDHRVQELVNLISLRRTDDRAEFLSPAHWRYTCPMQARRLT